MTEINFITLTEWELDFLNELYYTRAPYLPAPLTSASRLYQLQLIHPPHGAHETDGKWMISTNGVDFIQTRAASPMSHWTDAFSWIPSLFRQKKD